MKSMLIIIFVCALYVLVNAQNLVPNPSFEIYSACPTSTWQINRATDWSAFRESPDYFNVCSITCNPWCAGVPDNGFGSQEAIGNGYAGIILSYGAHEIMGVPLLDSLTIGTTYFVSAYASRAMGYNTGASNNLGFRFSTVAYSDTSPVPIDNYAHVNDTAIIMDTLNWVKIGGSFIADSSYKYLAIGNFFHDSLTHYDDPYNEDSYYYIDYVCVSRDSVECAQNFVGISIPAAENVSVYPNPFHDQLNIETGIAGETQMTLYDVSFRKVLSVKLAGKGVFGTSALVSGLYWYEIKNGERILGKGKIVKSE